MLLAFTFSMQGWGNVIGGLVTLVILYCYESSIKGGNVSKLNGVWRLIAGVILIPCLGTLYQRITLPESEKYKNARRLQEDPDALAKGLVVSDAKPSDGSHNGDSFDAEKKAPVSSANSDSDINPAHPDAAIVEEKGLGAAGVVKQRRAAFSETIEYFKDPRHALTLFGTASTWFLLGT